nr:hypothetical protein [Tanacetum cinerariifolium]
IVVDLLKADDVAVIDVDVCC